MKMNSQYLLFSLTRVLTIHSGNWLNTGISNSFAQGHWQLFRRWVVTICTAGRITARSAASSGCLQQHTASTAWINRTHSVRSATTCLLYTHSTHSTHSTYSKHNMDRQDTQRESAACLLYTHSIQSTQTDDGVQGMRQVATTKSMNMSANKQAAQFKMHCLLTFTTIHTNSAVQLGNTPVTKKRKTVAAHQNKPSRTFLRLLLAMVLE